MPTQPLTTPQAAKEYGVPERTLQRAIQTGELAAQRIDVRGGTYQLQPNDVAAFAEKWRERKAAKREAAMGGDMEVRMD